MKAKLTPKRRVHYILSTHWDREWYRTFQGFRRQLVHLLDRTIAGLASGFLKGPFTTDGQVIVLEDYLEIRPEKRAEIERLVKSGDFKIGPWYVLPDEWLVSGESIVRNLRLGRQMARAWGAEPSQAGFVCDLFGHISQLPQIFQGFGIGNAFMWRGVEPRASAHFLWEGADGTRILCYRFIRNGYCDFGFEVRRLVEPYLPFDAARVRADLDKYLKHESARTTVPPVLLFDGGDHMQVDEACYQVVAEAKAGPDFPYEIVFSTLDAYMEEVGAHASAIRDVVRGELREAGHARGDQDMQWLIPGVLSSRIWIKQANAECQTLLCQWAEPFASMTGAFLGQEYPEGYLDVAWKWLLQNHPHDSICGCSIDQVHEDMKYRFAQCRQIASDQADESLRLLAAAVPGELGANELRVLVANPLPRPLDEPLTLTLQLPVEWGSYQEFFGYEPKAAFRIFDANNREIPYQLVAQDLARGKHLYFPTKIPVSFKTNDVTVVVRVPLPSLGFTTLTVREGEKIPGTNQSLPTRHPQAAGLATGDRSMENEFLEVTLGAHGALTLRDKRTDETYDRLLTFEDAADIGDGWFHGTPVNDQTFTSTAVSADVALVSNGASLCQFRVRVEMRVPLEFNFERRTRSEQFQTLLIDSLVSLRAGSDRVEVRTTVDNTCKDHRLRVLFPTGTKGTTYLADSAFDVVERAIGLPKNNHLGRELAVEAGAQQTWTAVATGQRGLAIVTSGLPEAVVYDQPGRPLALTLFRATRRTVFTDGEPEGQIQGRMVFDYWIVPQAGTVERSRLCSLGQQIAAGIKTVQLRQPEIAFFRRGKTMPATASFFELKGDAIATSVRQVAGELEVRLFNPETRKIQARFEFPASTSRKPFQTATFVNLESQPIAKGTKMGSTYSLALRPKEIKTIRFR